MIKAVRLPFVSQLQKQAWSRLLGRYHLISFRKLTYLNRTNIHSASFRTFNQPFHNSDPLGKHDITSCYILRKPPTAHASKLHGAEQPAQQNPGEGSQGLKLQAVHSHVGTIIIWQVSWARSVGQCLPAQIETPNSCNSNAIYNPIKTKVWIKFLLFSIFR